MAFSGTHRSPAARLTPWACTTATAPVVRPQAVQIWNLCEELEDCSPVDAVPGIAPDVPQMGTVFSDPGDPLEYAVAVDDSLTGGE